MPGFDPKTIGAGALSLASTGFSAFGQREAARGQSAADLYKAEQLQRAAEYGELKAQQTGAQMTRNLMQTLGNIDATRAAGHIDPTSPSAVAVHDYVESTGSQQRGIEMANIEAQAREDEAGAAYLRQASSEALLGGDIGIAGTLLKGGAGLLDSLRPPS
jgi:hypothetical protein